MGVFVEGKHFSQIINTCLILLDLLGALIFSVVFSTSSEWKLFLRKMDDFLNIIKTTSDRNFLLAVKYSNIMELVQERLDSLKKNQSQTVTEPLPAEVSLPATRDTPVKSALADTSSQKQAVSDEHENDTDHTHGYPDSVDMVPTAEKLREVLAKNDDKFTVVKLGADWCKPCVKVWTRTLVDLTCFNRRDPLDEMKSVTYCCCYRLLTCRSLRDFMTWSGAMILTTSLMQCVT